MLLCFYSQIPSDFFQATCQKVLCPLYGPIEVILLVEVFSTEITIYFPLVLLRYFVYTSIMTWSIYHFIFCLHYSL